MGFFNSLKAMIKVKRQKHRYDISPSGDCYIRYIINKYINSSKSDDYIEAYENAITRSEEKVVEIPRYKKACFNKDGSINPQKTHITAAIFSLVIILYGINSADSYYELIENEDSRNMIKELVEYV